MIGRYIGAKSSAAFEIPCQTPPTKGDFPFSTGSPVGNVPAGGGFGKLGGIHVNTDTMWSDEHRIRNGDFSVATLGTGVPPDGFSMVTGVWATDAQVNDGSQKSGRYALQMIATAVATKIEGPMFPVVDGEKIRAGAEWMASGTGVTLTGTLRYFASDRVRQIGTDTTFFTKSPSGVSTYEIGENVLTVPAGARYARLLLAKSGVAVTVDIDRVWAGRSRQGEAVGHARLLDDVFASFNTSIPFDNTIPTLTEGNNYISLTYSPRMGGRSILIVDLDVFMGLRAVADHVVWTINDGTNTLSTDAAYCGTAAKAFHGRVVAERASPTSGTITFSSRFGRAATAGQVDINGVNGAQLFSTTKKSSLKITEISNV